MIKKFTFLAFVGAVSASHSVFAMEAMGGRPNPDPDTIPIYHRPNYMPDRITLEDIEKVPALANLTAPVGSGPVTLNGKHTITLNDKEYIIKLAFIPRFPSAPDYDIVLKDEIQKRGEGSLISVPSDSPEYYRYIYDLLSYDNEIRTGLHIVVDLTKK